MSGYPCAFRRPWLNLAGVCSSYFGVSQQRLQWILKLRGQQPQTYFRLLHRGEGPRASLMALGYAGWSAGQLDTELKDNAWLTVDADEALVVR